jgi:hypothetical protein
LIGEGVYSEMNKGGQFSFLPGQLPLAGNNSCCLEQANPVRIAWLQKMNISKGNLFLALVCWPAASRGCGTMLQKRKRTLKAQVASFPFFALKKPEEKTGESLPGSVSTGSGGKAGDSYFE